MQKFEVSPRAKSPSGWRGWLRPVAGGLLAALLAAFLWTYWDLDSFQDWKQRAHPVVFFSLMAVLPAFGFPVTPFYVLAGLTYGIPVGLTGTWLAIATNLALCFWVARSGLRPAIRRWITRSGFTLPEARRDQDLRFTLLVRLTPGIPSCVKSYLLALAGVSFRVYFPFSVAIAGSFATALVVLGESVLDFDPWEAGAAMLVLLLLAGAVAWWRRRRGGVEKFRLRDAAADD